MKQHNFERLKAQHSSENPIARLRVQAVSKGRQINNLPKCFKQENDIDPIVNICRGAKVQLMGRNFEPDWGLYNGSIGTVKEIVFERDENPLDGTLPQYVLVDFPEYCGPPWLKDKPKWVPIPPVELQCQSHCCNVKFIPLTLARTAPVTNDPERSSGLKSLNPSSKERFFLDLGNTLQLSWPQKHHELS